MIDSIHFKIKTSTACFTLMGSSGGNLKTMLKVKNSRYRAVISVKLQLGNILQILQLGIVKFLTFTVVFRLPPEDPV